MAGAVTIGVMLFLSARGGLLYGRIVCGYDD